MSRLGIFSLTAAALVVIDSAVAVGLHEDPGVSMAAIFARAVSCVLAGYAITQRKSDDAFVAPFLVNGAAFVSVSISDAVIIFTNASRWFVTGFSANHLALILSMALPAVASLVGAGLSLVLTRIRAPQRG